MTNSTHQINSPEMRPEHAARFMTVRYARYGLQKILRANKEFEQYLAGAQVVSEQMKTPEALETFDDTNEYPIVETQSVDTEAASNVVYFESSDKQYRTDNARSLVVEARRNEAA